MTESRDALVKKLAAELRPVENPGNIARPLALWLACTLVYSVAIVWATGGWRADAFGALLAPSALLLETLVAAAAIAALAHVALRSSIPDGRSALQTFRWPLIAVGVWLLLHAVGVWQSTGEPSMLGKREDCFWQGLLFSVPSFALLLWLARGLLPLRPRRTAAAAAAAAAAFPAILMQLACMLDPVHALTHHATPIFVLAAVGALAGRLVLVRRAPRRQRAATLH
jgi:hypothetical protein